jgi:hypothetical protein
MPVSAALVHGRLIRCCVAHSMRGEVRQRRQDEKRRDHQQNRIPSLAENQNRSPVPFVKRKLPFDAWKAGSSSQGFGKSLSMTTSEPSFSEQKFRLLISGTPGPQIAKFIEDAVRDFDPSKDGPEPLWFSGGQPGTRTVALGSDDPSHRQAARLNGLSHPIWTCS